MGGGGIPASKVKKKTYHGSAAATNVSIADWSLSVTGRAMLKGDAALRRAEGR